MENLAPVAAPSPAKSHKKLWLTIIGILILVLGGAGYAWYWAYGQAMLLNRQMSWQWLNERPNFQIQANIDFSLRSANPNNMKLTGATNLHNSGKDFSGSADLDLFIDEKKMDFKIDYLKKENLVFLKPEITGLEIYLDYAMGSKGLDPADTSQIDYRAKQWIENDFNDETLLEYINKVNDFLEKAKDNNIFKIKDIHQTKDTTDGRLMAIQYSVPEDKADILINALFEFEKSSWNEEKFEKFKNDQPEDLEEMRKTISKLTFVLWINTKTKNIQGMDISIKDFSFDYGLSAMADLEFSFLITSAEAMDIALPTNTISTQEYYDDFIQEVMMPYYYSELEPLDDLADTDDDGLLDTQEELYGTDLSNPDSDGDGYLDGEEVNNGYNPMGEGILQNSPNIRAEAMAFCSGFAAAFILCADNVGTVQNYTVGQPFCDTSPDILDWPALPSGYDSVEIDDADGTDGTWAMDVVDSRGINNCFELDESGCYDAGSPICKD